MKYAILLVSSAFLGAVTAALGCGWTVDGKFNPGGAFINILGVILINLLVALIPNKKGGA